MPLKFYQHQLPNGLDLIAEENADSHSISIGMFVRTGSRDETAAINGVSHFLEHMMFKGSDRYTWEDMNRIFDELGARYNAYTSQEMTAYYANVLPEFSEKAMEHLAHLLRPALRHEDFETEKNVILEEIAMYLDDPGHRLYEDVVATHFGNHSLSMSVLGPAETIRALKREEMEAYFRQRYGPGNMVVAVTGRFDFDEVVRLVERYCGDWPRVEAQREQPAPMHKPQRKILADPKLKRTYTMAMAPAPSAQDVRRFAARVLADVIGDSEGSRLYWALVDPAIAEEAYFDYQPYDDCGSYFISLATPPERTDQALDIALSELQKVKQDLTDDEVERAKNKIASSIVLQGEVPIGRMQAIGRQWIYNKEYRSLERDMQTLTAITPDDLRRLMSEFPFDPMTVCTLGPAPDAEKAGAGHNRGTI